VQENHWLHLNGCSPFIEDRTTPRSTVSLSLSLFYILSSSHHTHTQTHTHTHTHTYSYSYTGKVYWLYHGECTNDEKNSLTGVIDSGLTEFGTYQAKQAGRDACKTIKREGKEFTYVYTSYMLRALETMKIVSRTTSETKSSSDASSQRSLVVRSTGLAISISL